MNFREIPSVKDQIRKCVRCGRCRTVCPVFAEIRNESAAPRGHVFISQMLRDGEVKPEPAVYEKLSNCLLCETCSVYCPSGIDIHEINEAARSYVYASKPSLAKDMIFDTVWTHPGILRTGSMFMALAGKLGLQSAARAAGLTRLLPGDLSQAEQIMQDLPVLAARRRLRAFNQAIGERRMKVAYFLGCGTDMFSPGVAIAAVKVLTRAGCDVVIPEDMKCCGLPHVANGKMDTAVELALHNIKVFNLLDVDYIVTDCASCSSALSYKRLAHLLQGKISDEELQRFTNRVYDLSLFLTEVLAYSPDGLKTLDIKVTYHDPCHLAKAQGIRQAPRDIIRMVPGVELIEMADSDRCCGGSGTFSLTHYDLSMKILDKKMNSIADTGASVIATSCPSCTLQLKHGVRRKNMKADVKHPVELLASALRTN